MASKSKFIPGIGSQVSHELRIPLSCIVGLIEFLRGTKLSVEQTDYVEQIKSSAERLVDAQVEIDRLIEPLTRK